MNLLRQRLGVDPEGFGRVFKALRGLGFRDCTWCRVLEEFPRVTTMRENEILGKVEFLRRIGVENDEMDRIVNAFPGLLGLNTEIRLGPLLGEFRRLGFRENVVKDEIIREPKILSMEPGEMSRCFELLWSLKCREAIKEKIFREGSFRAGLSVTLRVNCLCRHGLIRRDALKVLWKEPRLILYGIDEIDKKVEFLVNNMGYDVECLVDVPEYLGVNFEKQIVPRHNVIEYLRSIGGLGDPVSLRDLIKPTRQKFYNLYVKPYPECEKIFSNREVQTMRKQHPVGLWTLFKPRKYPQSRDDIENMKSFMESKF